MLSSEPRRGIERKILTTILWVGLLPTLLALFVGSITSIEQHRASVEPWLSALAGEKAAGLRQATDLSRQTVANIAAQPSIIAVLRPDAETGRQDPAALRSLLQRMQRHAQIALGRRAAFKLYDAEGVEVVPEGDGQGERQPAPWFGKVHYPRIVDMSPAGKGGTKYKAQIIAPVYAPEKLERPLGFVSVDTLMAPIQPAPLRYDATGQDAPDYVCQILRISEEQAIISRLAPDSNRLAPELATTQEVDPRLLEAVQEDPTRTRGRADLPNYQNSETRDNVLLAYEEVFRLPDGTGIYYITYRPAPSPGSYLVNYMLSTRTVLLFLVCFLFIAILCLNAYLNVHKNIVRNVLLLNSGAQIIGQGDLELKLKINTNDELEELASSFNKMALALKQNIRQLEESEEKYRSLVTSMRDGIYQTDNEGIVSFINPAGVEILGFESVDDAIGTELRGLFAKPEDFVRIRSEIETNRFLERTRVWMRRRDGRSICVEITGNQILDDDGTVIGIEGIFRDVTTSVRLEQEAKDRSERISAINQIANVINSSLEAGRLYDSLVVELHKLVDFDFAALALLSESGDAFETRQLWPEQDTAPTYISRLDDLETCAAWVAHERECLLVDDLTQPGEQFGRQFPEGIVSCLCVPLYASGRIIGTLNLGSKVKAAFSGHDISVLEHMAPHLAVAIGNAQLLDNLQASLDEVTKAREELHIANEELKTLDEMKTNLLSNVSHELRTPLVAVMGYTDMIYNGKTGEVNDVQREYLGISLRNIEKLVTLIENLLDFSRLHRGTETLVFDTFDLFDCARASMQIVRPVADSRNITLDLVGPDEQVLVEGDKGKLGQVFNNLLSNAVKFNHEGGNVTIEITPGDDAVRVEVRDTGIGIPEEALDKVFTRFYQFDSSSTRKYGGTGIGLSIAQDIVRLHGSRITVASEEGKGSTFRFSLPLAAAQRRETPSGGRQLPLPTETKLLIELVSHDRAISMQVRNLLVSEGMDVIHALNVEHAVSLARKHSPDCILVDYDGNEMSPEVLEILLAEDPDKAVPVVLITNDDEVYDCHRTRVASRVKRGFRKSTLLSGIRYALERGAARATLLGSKILCVDDDPEILTFMRRCLENEGYEVDTCDTGEEALAAASSREYEAVLLDIAMPGMDGWEACRRLKTDPKLAGMRVYMVTAKPIDRSALQTHESQADGLLSKPFRPEELIDLVRGAESFRNAPEV